METRRETGTQVEIPPTRSEIEAIVRDGIAAALREIAAGRVPPARPRVRRRRRTAVAPYVPTAGEGVAAVVFDAPARIVAWAQSAGVNLGALAADGLRAACLRAKRSGMRPEGKRGLVPGAIWERTTTKGGKPLRNRIEIVAAGPVFLYYRAVGRATGQVVAMGYDNFSPTRSSAEYVLVSTPEEARP